VGEDDEGRLGSESTSGIVSADGRKIFAAGPGEIGRFGSVVANGGDDRQTMTERIPSWATM